MLPLIAVSISASPGFGLEFSNAAADMICPDWQYPHCGTSASIQARCAGWPLSFDRPSIVVTLFPSTAFRGITHERTAIPSTCTVQAPQSAMPHPYLVPVSDRWSRSTQRSGVSASASMFCVVPLTVRVTMCQAHLVIEGRLMLRDLADSEQLPFW